MTDKHNMSYLYSGILFSSKKKWSTDTCDDMDEFNKEYCKWNWLSNYDTYLMVPVIWDM